MLLVILINLKAAAGVRSEPFLVKFLTMPYHFYHMQFGLGLTNIFIVSNPILHALLQEDVTLGFEVQSGNNSIDIFRPMTGSRLKEFVCSL